MTDKILKIYDYDNNCKKIKLKDKAIRNILVTIISRDEVVTIFYKDGDLDIFDSSSCRLMDFQDGSYIVKEEDIKRWMDFKPQKEGTISYERQEAFG